jgi:putative tryptophan/tyrosine transport system substrate-binding protein
MRCELKKVVPLPILIVMMQLAAGLTAEAQQPTKIPRIAFLGTAPASVVAARVEAFREGLRELGYLEGKNIVIEYRFGEGKSNEVTSLAVELARSTVDVIVTAGPAATRSA